MVEEPTGPGEGVVTAWTASAAIVTGDSQAILPIGTDLRNLAEPVAIAPIHLDRHSFANGNAFAKQGWGNDRNRSFQFAAREPEWRS